MTRKRDASAKKPPPPPPEERAELTPAEAELVEHLAREALKRWRERRRVGSRR